MTMCCVLGTVPETPKLTHVIVEEVRSSLELRKKNKTLKMKSGLCGTTCDVNLQNKLNKTKSTK